MNADSNPPFSLLLQEGIETPPIQAGGFGSTFCFGYFGGGGEGYGFGFGGCANYSRGGAGYGGAGYRHRYGNGLHLSSLSRNAVILPPYSYPEGVIFR